MSTSASGKTGKTLLNSSFCTHACTHARMHFIVLNFNLIVWPKRCIINTLKYKCKLFKSISPRERSNFPGSDIMWMTQSLRVTCTYGPRWKQGHWFCFMIQPVHLHKQGMSAGETLCRLAGESVNHKALKHCVHMTTWMTLCQHWQVLSPCMWQTCLLCQHTYLNNCSRYDQLL